MSQITIDLREAYDADVTSLPEIEIAIDKLLKVTGRTVGVTILRESLELVHSANVFNLLSAIQKGDEEADFLRAAFLQIAAPERNTTPPDLSKLRGYSNEAKELFIWIINYRSQKSFEQQKLTVLLNQVDSIQQPEKPLDPL